MKRILLTLAAVLFCGIVTAGTNELFTVVGYQKFLITDIIGNRALSGISDAA